jgi:hypothetical protein
VVQGNGSFLPLVTWVINQGGGQLSATTGANVTYYAPLVTSTPVSVVIYAISQSDSTKFGELDLTVTAAPDPGTYLDGTTYSGTEQMYRTWGPAPVTSTYAQHYTFTKVDANHVIIQTLQYWNAPGEYPVVLTLNSDGTLTFPSNFGGIIQTVDYPAGGQYQAWIAHGSGAWDYHGNISFVVQDGQDGYFGTLTDQYTFSATRQ